MIYSDLAQKALDRVVNTMRVSGDLNAAVSGALEDLAAGLSADRAVLWQINDDSILTATHEFVCQNGLAPICGTKLYTREAMHVLHGFLCKFPDESAMGVIQLNGQSQNLVDWEAFMRSSKDFSATMLIQLSARGNIYGYIAVQSTQARQWTPADVSTLQKVAEMMALVVAQGADFAASLKPPADSYASV